MTIGRGRKLVPELVLHLADRLGLHFPIGISVCAFRSLPSLLIRMSQTSLDGSCQWSYFGDGFRNRRKTWYLR